MAIKLNLNSQEILNKQFSNVVHGYDALEVDEFIDRIINDYRKVESNALVSNSDIETLKGKIADLQNKISELEIEKARYEKFYKDAKGNTNVSLDNIDLLKRIDAYEKYIYKLGVNPNTIK